MDNSIIDPEDDDSNLGNEKILSIAILIFLVVAIGAFAMTRSDMDFDADLLKGSVPEGEEEQKVDEEGAFEEIDLDDSEEKEESKEESEEEVEEDQIAQVTEETGNFEEVDSQNHNTNTGDTYQTEAQAGEGMTHVARRVAKDYLQGRDLSPEQMVYVEDYIQKNAADGSGFLQKGEEVEISHELIEEAVQEAEQLTQEEIENLSQFTTSAHNI